MTSIALISQEEWEIAESCLKTLPNGTKIKKSKELIKYTHPESRKEVSLGHSFIKIEEIVFALGDRLGRGAYGKVKLLQQKTDEVYAVKITDKINQTEADIVKDLGMERARPIARIDGYKTYHTMIYLGMNFLKFLRQGLIQISKEQLLDYSIQCVTQVDEFHKGKTSALGKKRLHGDVKERNFVIQNGKITLIDFGFSKVIENEDSVIHGQKGGTYAYMAPEVYLGLPTQRSDIYSLGIILDRLNRNNNNIRHLAALMKNKNQKLRPSLDLVKIFLTMEAEHSNYEVCREFNISFDTAKAIALALQFTKMRYPFADLLIKDIKSNPFLSKALAICSSYLDSKKTERFVSHGKEATQKLVSNLLANTVLRTEATIKREVASYLAGKKEYGTWYGGASRSKNNGSRISYVYSGGLFGRKITAFSSLTKAELKTFETEVNAYC